MMDCSSGQSAVTSVVGWQTVSHLSYCLTNEDANVTHLVIRAPDGVYLQAPAEAAHPNCGELLWRPVEGFLQAVWTSSPSGPPSQGLWTWSTLGKPDQTSSSSQSHGRQHRTCRFMTIIIIIINIFNTNKTFKGHFGVRLTLMCISEPTAGASWLFCRGTSALVPASYFSSEGSCRNSSRHHPAKVGGHFQMKRKTGWRTNVSGVSQSPSLPEL